MINKRDETGGYNVENPDEIIYELVCDSCGAEYDLVVNDQEKNEPIYCAFCGTDMDVIIDDEDEKDYYELVIDDYEEYE